MAVIGASGFGKPRPELNDAFYDYDLGGVMWAAPKAMPIVPVDTETGTIETLAGSNFTSTKTGLWARGANTNVLDMTVSSLTYSCTRYGFAEGVDPRDSSVLQMNKDRAATQIISNQILRGWETRSAAVLQSTGTFTGASLYLDVTTAWSNVAADIIGDVDYATTKIVANSGSYPDTIVLDYINLSYMKKNTAIRAAIAGAQVVTDAVLLGLLPAIFGLKKIIVDSTGIFSNSYVTICKTADTADITEPCVARTIAYAPDLAGGGAQFDEYVDPNADQRMIRGRFTSAEVLMNANLGFMLKVD